MTWARAPVAAALVELLAAVDPAVSVFGAPPATFNPPALVVWYPHVQYDAFAFGVDLVRLPILVAVSPLEWEPAEALAAAVKKAIDADTTIGGTVPVARSVELTDWREMKVGGADALGAQHVLEIRM